MPLNGLFGRASQPGSVEYQPLQQLDLTRQFLVLTCHFLNLANGVKDSRVVSTAEAATDLRQ